MTTVLHVLEATEGGTRRHLRDLAAALDPQAFRSVLAVSCGRDPAFRAEDVARWRAANVSVHELPMCRGIAPLRDAVALTKLVRLIHRVRPDIVHAHSSKAGFLSRLAGACCRVPVVYTPHVFPFLMRGGACSRRCYRTLERCVLPLTAAVIAVSREEFREALRLGYAPARVFFVPNGVAPLAEKPVGTRTSGTLRVGFFGRLARQKGADVLLAAMAGVVAQAPNVRVSLFGQGEDETMLRAQVKSLNLSSFVTFEGVCRSDETIARMRGMDLVAVPSRWEGCPYVVLEAFQAGVPVVASAVGGVPDLIRGGENGVLVPPDDVEPLSGAVLHLLRAPSERERLADGGRKTAAGYTLRQMADATADVYRSVVEPDGRK